MPERDKEQLKVYALQGFTPALELFEQIGYLHVDLIVKIIKLDIHSTQE
jgi:hypothetical protein